MLTSLRPNLSSFRPSGNQIDCRLIRFVEGLSFNITQSVRKRGLNLPDSVFRLPFPSQFLRFSNLDRWAYEHGIGIDFSRPGKPTDNAAVESFNGRLRQECLNEHWFLSLADAQRKIEQWRVDYNQVRSHSALGWSPPADYARKHAVSGPRRRLKEPYFSSNGWNPLT